MLGGDAVMAELSATYGLPMGTWCVCQTFKTFPHLFYTGRNSRVATYNTDITTWNVSKVSSMYYMLLQAAVFDQDLSSWNTSSVEDLSAMFTSVSSFNKDLAAWDLSKVSTMANKYKPLIN
jgi:hypothetical protein